MALSILSWLQDRLNFTGCRGPQFSHDEGLGRIAIIAAALGVILGIHLTIIVGVLALGRDKPWTATSLLWCSYVVLLCLFHLSEFFVTAIYNPMATTADSFIVNHSATYTIAVLGSIVEFWLEALFIPSMKRNHKSIVLLGLILVIGGALCRQVAMATCGSNFHHKIQHQQRSSHFLVISGIYKYLRHPSYVGWFYWSIGTQMLLLNPVCSVLYTLAAWHFFRIRIPYEEALLLRQYPNQYPAYMDASYIGIPFIWSAKTYSPSPPLTASSSKSHQN